MRVVVVVAVGFELDLSVSKNQSINGEPVLRPSSCPSIQ